MARKIRLEYAGAAYHIMARGNQGRDIYAADRNRELWLKTLGDACEKTGWRIHTRLKSDVCGRPQVLSAARMIRVRRSGRTRPSCSLTT
jgi:hypothetical protein